MFADCVTSTFTLALASKIASSHHEFSSITFINRSALVSPCLLLQFVLFQIDMCPVQK